MKLKIKLERMKRNWTLEYVANKTGLTKTAIRLIEIGQRKPSYEILVILEDLFQMNHRELLGMIEEDDEHRKQS